MLLIECLFAIVDVQRLKDQWLNWRGTAVVQWTATQRPGFDSRGGRCKNGASGP